MSFSLWWLNEEYRYASSCHISRNRDKLNNLFSAQSFKKGGGINMLQSSCWAQGSLQISAHQLPQCAPSPLWASEDSCSACLSVCLSVRSLYYQRAAHIARRSAARSHPTLLFCLFLDDFCIYCSLLRRRSKRPELLRHFFLSTFSKSLGFVLLQPKHEFSRDCSQPDWYARLLAAVKWNMNMEHSSQFCLRVFYFQSEALKTENS